jgi:uncharacterized protein
MRAAASGSLPPAGIGDRKCNGHIHAQTERQLKELNVIDDLADARAALAGVSVWSLTDGKAGDEAQCLGVTERLGLAAELRHVRPRRPYAWLMPHGPIDPAEAPGRPDSPIRPPFPDIAIGSGRRAVAYLRRVRSETGGRTFTVFLKDPRVGLSAADMIWVPEHDPLRGENVLVTLSSPHRISAERLVAAAAQPVPWAKPKGRPLVAVLLGGDSQHFTFTEDDNRRLITALEGIVRDGAYLAVTPSRRTPAALAGAIEALVAASGGFWWNGTGENPFVQLLAHATAIVATADSVNMAGEAAATGKPILLFTPSGGHGKIQSFLDGLELHGAVRPLSGRLELWSYEPVDATPVIAIELARRFLRHRERLS